MHLLIVDFSQAFNSVLRHKLEEVMITMDVLGKMVTTMEKEKIKENSQVKIYAEERIMEGTDVKWSMR